MTIASQNRDLIPGVTPFPKQLLILILLLITTAPAFSLTKELDDSILHCSEGKKTECKIHNAYGIAHIRVETPAGKLESKLLFNRHFPDCSSEAEASWPRTENAIISITTCEASDSTYHHLFGDIRGTAFMTDIYEMQFKKSSIYSDYKSLTLEKSRTRKAFPIAGIGDDGDDSGTATCYSEIACESLARWCAENGGVGSCPGGTEEIECTCTVPD